MNRVTRRMLTLVSIVGGGLLGAAPVAAAAPSDPTPPPPSGSAATSEVPPIPVPVPEPVVRTGRAPAPGDPGGSPSVSLTAPGDGPTVSVRTGRAADLVPGVDPSTAAGPTGASTGPSAPGAPPSTPPSTPHTRATSPDPATNNAAASGTAKPPAASVATGPPPPDPTSHTTVAGDDLWSIAATQVAQVTGQPAASLSSADVAAYWQRVCDANRPHLQSGDINLIFPGEQIVLPPVSG
jgi:hypothetical protein